MATETFATTVFKCDRCTSEHSFPRGTVPADWLLLNAQTRSGAPVMPGRYMVELCEECTTQFREWLTGLDRK